MFMRKRSALRRWTGILLVWSLISPFGQVPPAAAAEDEPPQVQEPAPPPPTFEKMPRKPRERVAVPEGEPMLEFESGNVEIRDLLIIFGRHLKKIFIPDPSLDGTVTIIAPFPLTHQEAFDVLAAALRVRGYAMSGTIKDKIIRVTPIQNAIRDLTVADQLVTQIVPVKNVPARLIEPELRQFLTQNSILVPTSTGNSLIITDTEANAKRIAELVEKLDVDLSTLMSLEIIQLKNMEAAQMAQLLNQVFSQLGIAAAAADSRPAPAPPPATAPQAGAGTGAPAPTSPAVRPTSLIAPPSVHLIPETNTNSVIIWAPKEKMSEVRSLVERLDQAVPTAELKVFSLQYANATELQRVLSQAVEGRGGAPTPSGASGAPAGVGQPAGAAPQPSGARAPTAAQVVLVAEPRTNHLIVAATKPKMDLVEELIRKFDIRVEPPVQLEIVPLKYAYAPSLAQTLQTLFPEAAPRQPGQPGAPQVQPVGQPGQPVGQPGQPGTAELRAPVRIAPEERSNALVIRGTKEDVALIKEVVEKLDQDFAPAVKYKVFKLENADATLLANQLYLLFEEGVGPTQQPRRGGFGFGLPFEQRVTAPSERLLGLRQNVVIPDTRTNSLIVTATDALMPMYEQLIKELDQPVDLRPLVKTYKVENVDVKKLAETINLILQAQRPQQPGFDFFFTPIQQRIGAGVLEALKDITVIADEPTNKLIVTAPPYAFDIVDKIVEELDQPLPQVFIQVLIADVTLTKDRPFGVEWEIVQGRISGLTEAEGQVGAEFGLEPESPSGLFYRVLSRDFNSFLQTQISEGKVKVHAVPAILTLDNTEAKITIGQQVPLLSNIFRGVEGIGSTIGIELKDIATELTVTPHINNENYILMDINQKIDDLGPFINLGGFDQPIVNRREAKTSVRVKTGETIVIGGIVRDRVSKTRTGIPLLSWIPFLGDLFSRAQKTTERTELMVFLTPYIVQTDEDLKQLTDQQRKLMESPPNLKRYQPKKPTTPSPSAPKGSSMEGQKEGTHGQGGIVEGQQEGTHGKKGSVEGQKSDASDTSPTPPAKLGKKKRR